MKTLLLGSSIAFAVTICLIYSNSFRASQETGPKTAQSTAAEPCPNTADGLHSLLTDLLAVAKGDDEGKVWSKIAEMEIPDYETWFTRTYGQEKGQALAGAYGKSLMLSEQQFEMLWVELAKQEGEITINRLDAANRRFDLAKKDDALANPADEFKADWKKTDTSAGPARQAIGYFYIVNGKFRLKNFPHEVQILSTAKTGPVVPGKLINRVQPVYPEAAKNLRLRGLVSVNVVVHKDGTVTVQNVGAGHALLSPAAVAAVQQWKYEPTTVGGEPVEVQAKVYVTFEFSQQTSEQNPTGQTLTADIDAVVAAGRITANQYQNDYFALTLTADDGVIQAPSLVNRDAQRARLADTSSNAKVGEKRYSVGLLVDAQAKNPQIHSPEQYIRAVRQQLQKDGLETVREEFPIDVSGVAFVGAVMKVTVKGNVYYRGLYGTFLNGYILSLDIKADTPERLTTLISTMIRFKTHSK